MDCEVASGQIINQEKSFFMVKKNIGPRILGLISDILGIKTH